MSDNIFVTKCPLIVFQRPVLQRSGGLEYAKLVEMIIGISRSSALQNLQTVHI